MGVGFKPYDPEGSTLHEKSAKGRLDGSLAHRCSLASPLGEARKQKTGHQSRGGTTAWEGWSNRIVFVARTHTHLPSLLPYLSEQVANQLREGLQETLREHLPALLPK